MLPARKRQLSARWWQALLLLALGTGMGYPSLNALGHCAWGGDCRYGPYSYLVVSFASATAFLSGIVLFVAIATRSLLSKPVPPSTALVGAPTVAYKSASYDASGVLASFRIATLVAIALSGIDLLRRAGPSLSSSYGRFLLLNALLTLVFSQLPLAIALVRAWTVPDHAGLALAIAAGAIQVIFNVPSFYTSVLNLPRTMMSSWSLLHAALGAILVLLAYFVWRASGSRQGDVGLMISIFFGLLAYTVLWRVALAFLSAHERIF